MDCVRSRAGRGRPFGLTKRKDRWTGRAVTRIASGRAVPVLRRVTGGDRRRPGCIGLKQGKRMFNSPLEYCPHCRQYVALDSTPKECAAKYRCGVEVCPLRAHFTGRQMDPTPEASARDVGRPGDVSSAPTSLLRAMARGVQVEFSSADLGRLLHGPQDGIEALADDLLKRGLIRVTDGPEEERRYVLTAAGRRYVTEQVSRTARVPGGDDK